MTKPDFIFAPIFGENWEKLPKIFQKHYANKSYSEDIYTTTGMMNIYIAPFLRPFKWVLALTRTLVPINAHNVKTVVRFCSEPESGAFWFDRSFYSGEMPPLKFKSRMMPIGGNIVIEYTQSGLGWKAAYEFKNNRVLLHHKGYILRIFGFDLNLPLDWLLGQSSAIEEAVDDNNFIMSMEIKHWLFGKLFGYDGSFEMKD